MLFYRLQSLEPDNSPRKSRITNDNKSICKQKNILLAGYQQLKFDERQPKCDIVKDTSMFFDAPNLPITMHTQASK